MSNGDLIVIGIVVALVAMAIASLWYSRKKGKSSCGCNCSGCSGASACGRSPNVTIEDEESCECCKKN